METLNEFRERLRMIHAVYLDQIALAMTVATNVLNDDEFWELEDWMIQEGVCTLPT